MTAEKPDHQPVVGNNGKIESLKIENLMNKMEKVSNVSGSFINLYFYLLTENQQK